MLAANSPAVSAGTLNKGSLQATATAAGMRPVVGKPRKLLSPFQFYLTAPAIVRPRRGIQSLMWLPGADRLTPLRHLSPGVLHDLVEQVAGDGTGARKSPARRCRRGF